MQAWSRALPLSVWPLEVREDRWGLKMARGDRGGPRVWDLTKVIVMIPFARNGPLKGVTLGTKNGDSGRNGEWNQKWRAWTQIWRQSLVC